MENFKKLKEKLEEVISEFKIIFSEDFYKKLITVLESIEIKKFLGFLVFSKEKKDESSPEKLICKLSLVDNVESSSEKIILKVTNYIDKEKAEKYAEAFSLELDENGDSDLKKKLKEYLEESANKTAFEASFSEEIYKNLITILNDNS